MHPEFMPHMTSRLSPVRIVRFARLGMPAAAVMSETRCPGRSAARQLPGRRLPPMHGVGRVAMSAEAN